MRKYALPSFLEGRLDQSRYENWLRRKALAHSKGDVKRFGKKHTAEHYRDMIHSAVISSAGRDCYTGEELHWEKVSTYNNEASRAGKSKYKAGFSLLPTVDHVWDESGEHSFVICGWQMNDTKSDLRLNELLHLCESILVNHGYSVQKPARTGA